MKTLFCLGVFLHIASQIILRSSSFPPFPNLPFFLLPPSSLFPSPSFHCIHLFKLQPSFQLSVRRRAKVAGTLCSNSLGIVLCVFYCKMLQIISTQLVLLTIDIPLLTTRTAGWKEKEQRGKREGRRRGKSLSVSFYPLSTECELDSAPTLSACVVNHQEWATHCI